MNNQTEKIPVKLIISVIATCIISFCGLLTETAVNVAFPSIMKDFSVDTSTVQWLTTGNLLAIAMITPLAAFLQKRFKIKHLFIFSALLFLFASALAFFSGSFEMLVVARVVQGIAVGVGVPLVFCIILEQIPNSHKGLYIGLGALVSAAAPAIGPTFGGIIDTNIGWRYIFAILIPLLLVAIIIGCLSIQQTRKTEKAPVDIKGIFLIMITFFCLIYGFSNIGNISSKPILILGMFIIGFAALVLFVTHSNKIKSPLVQLCIFKNYSFVGHLVAFFLINALMLGMSFLLPNYLQNVSGLDSMRAGMILLPGAVVNAIMGPISGKILDKNGAKLPALSGVIIMLVGVILFAIFGKTLTPTMICAFYIIFGFGCGTSFGSTMTSGMSRISQKRSADGNTLFNTLLQFAGAVGTSVVAAFVGIAQSLNISGTAQASTAAGVQYGMFFLIILAIGCVAAQIVAFKSADVILSRKTAVVL